MEQYPDFQELGFTVDEAEAAPRIRILRELARIIAHDLINSRHDGKNSDDTTMSDQRNGLNHDEGLH